MPSSVEANLPPTNEGYGTHEYWEQRYTNEADGTTFDWFLTPSYLLPLFEELTGDIGEHSTSSTLDAGQGSRKDKGKDARILMLGCGNSALGEVMYDAGWTNIVNVDYSRTVIEQMQSRHEQRSKMTWLEMDVLDLSFQDEEFDLVVDKGTMDAMLTSRGDPWNPSEKDVIACTQEVTEALSFTFGQPHFRKRYLQDRPGFTLSHKEIGPPEGFAYFMYTLAYDAHNSHIDKS